MPTFVALYAFIGTFFTEYFHDINKFGSVYSPVNLLKIPSVIVRQTT